MALIEAGKPSSEGKPAPAAAADSPRPRMKVKPSFVGSGPGVALSITEW
jgi:hypothetical protein